MDLLIYGSGDFALTVEALVEHCGHNAIGRIDDFNSGANILGSLEVVKQSYPPQQYGIAMAIGYANIPARWAAWEKAKLLGYQAPPLIHTTAYVANSVSVNEGVMVMAHSIVDVRAQIGELSVLWPGTCINHDSVIGANCFVSPSSTICGFSQVGAHTFIGAGSVIADHTEVPEASYLKMMSRYKG